MSRKRYTPEQIISMLREAEVALAHGQSVGQACRTLGVSEQSCYRWRKKYGGLRTDQAKRLKDLEKENGRAPRGPVEAHKAERGAAPLTRNMPPGRGSTPCPRSTSASLASAGG